MKWTYSWLNQHGSEPFSFHEQVAFDQELIKSKAGVLLDLKDVEVKGQGRFDPETKHLTLTLEIKGVMIVPCALSLEPTPYPFQMETEEVFTFDRSEDNGEYWIATRNEVDLQDPLWQLICLEIPLKVVKEGATIQSSGEGWRLIQDDELVDDSDVIDPRLAKLKDYFKK